MVSKQKGNIMNIMMGIYETGIEKKYIEKGQITARPAYSTQDQNENSIKPANYSTLGERY